MQSVFCSISKFPPIVKGKIGQKIVKK